MDTLKIATRGSPLAIWQSEYVKELLLLKNPQLEIKLIPIKTSGDKFLGSLLFAGGKGLFVKEIEQCLLNKTADIAVHSMKDLPQYSPEGLEIVCILEREDPRDTLVTQKGETIYDLKSGSVVGTSSLRRKSQLMAVRRDIKYRDLRGNVDSRLKKIDEGEFSAIVLATAGLRRLGLLQDNYSQFDISLMLPAVGQGAIGVQAMKENSFARDLLKPLACDVSMASVKAERKMVQMLGGECGSPIAALARLEDGLLVMDGLVSDLEGRTILRSRCYGSVVEPEGLGKLVGRSLLEKGAGSLLDSK